MTGIYAKVVPLGVTLTALVLWVGCTGARTLEERDATIVAAFTGGIPSSAEVRTGVEPSNSCVAIDRESGTTTLRVRISGNDPNGLAALSVASRRRTGTWTPTVRILTAEPSGRVIRGGDESRIAFTESPPPGEVQLSAIAEVEIDVESGDTSFDNPAVISFRAYDVGGNVTSTPTVDLRRVLDPPPATTTGVFVCMNGTAQ